MVCDCCGVVASVVFSNLGLFWIWLDCFCCGWVAGLVFGGLVLVGCVCG